MAALVACLVGMPPASLEVVAEGQAEMEEVQSRYCGLGCGRTKVQEDQRSRIGWRHRDHAQGES